MRRPKRAGAPKTKTDAAGITAIPSAPQALHHYPAAQPSAAEIRNECLAKSALAPDVVPRPEFGVSWLIFRDRRAGLQALRAISAEDLERAPFPETRGTA